MNTLWVGRLGHRRRPTASVLLLMLMFAGTATVASADVAGLRSWLDEHQQHRSFSVSFGALTYEGTSIGSSLSRHVERLVAEAASSSIHWEYVDGGVLRFLPPQDRAIFEELVRAKASDALIWGTYSLLGDHITVELTLTNLTNGLRIGSKRLPMRTSRLPAGVNPMPPDLERALALGADLSGEVTLQDTELQLHAVTDRGDGGVYYDGEELRITVLATENVYLKVYHVDVYGNVQLIFPNEYHRDNRVRANTVTTIPGPGYPFAFVLGPPYGTEFLQVLASRSQFAEIEQAFAALGSVRSYRTRGLNVRQRAGEVREIQLSYTMLE